MLRSRSTSEFLTVGLVSGGHFFSHFYLLTFPPLFPFLRAEFTLNNTQLGLIVSLISFGMLLQIPVGELVDRIGGKWVFVGGMVLTALGILLAGFAPSYLVVLAMAGLSGIGQAAYHPADYALVEAVSDTDRLGKNFSIHTFGGYVGFTIAPILVGSLGVVFSWRLALICVGAVGLVYGLLTAILLRPVYQDDTVPDSDRTESTRTSSRSALLRPGILIMSVFFIVITMAEKGIQTFTPLLVLDGFQLSGAVGNTTLSVFFAITAVGVLLGGIVADRYDPRGVIAGATTIAAIAVIVPLTGIFPLQPGPIAMAFGLAGGAFGLVFASRDRLVSEQSASGTTGRSFGFVFTASSIGSITSPILLGAVIDTVSIRLAFGLVAGFFALSGLVVLTLGANPRHRLRKYISP